MSHMPPPADATLPEPEEALWQGESKMTVINLSMCLCVYTGIFQSI